MAAPQQHMFKNAPDSNRTVPLHPYSEILKSVMGAKKKVPIPTPQEANPTARLLLSSNQYVTDTTEVTKMSPSPVPAIMPNVAYMTISDLAK